MKGYVLAGGRSTRMGRDKALLIWQGQPLIARAVGLLRCAGLDPYIAASRPDLATFAPVIDDLHPGCGPLSGIEAALAQCGEDAALFVPVDVPILPAQFLRQMIERAALTGAAATIPKLLGRPQPLCAIYQRELLPIIRHALNAGDYKVMGAVMQAKTVDLFSMEAVEAARIEQSAPPVHRWFQNLNRPEDLACLTAK